MAQRIEDSTPAEIRAAIWQVRTTRSLRTRQGHDAFDCVLLAPEHRLPLAALEAQFGATNLHLGWFCRHVAYRLGIEDPEEFALFDRAAQAGRLVLSLKPCVAAAITG